MALRVLEIASLFDATIIQRGIARSKPDPEIVLLAVKKLGGRPDRCLFIEDSPSGVKAAVAAANLSCIAFTTGYVPAELPDATLWIEDFRAIDVPAIEVLQANR